MDMMEIGIDSFAAILHGPNTSTDISPAKRLANLLGGVPPIRLDTGLVAIGFV